MPYTLNIYSVINIYTNYISIELERKKSTNGKIFKLFNYKGKMKGRNDFC